MPTPEQWSEEQFQTAKQLLSSGKGSAAQRQKLESALNSYWTAKTGNLGIADSSPPTERVSRETTSSDPFASYDAETQKLGADNGPPPGPPRPGMLETAGSHFLNGQTLGFGPDVGAQGQMDPTAALSGAQSFTAPGADELRQQEGRRGQLAQRQAQGKQDNPDTAFWSELAGVTMSPLMEGLGALGGVAGRSLGLTGKVGRAAEAAGSGMAQGAASGGAMAPEGRKVEGMLTGGAAGGVLGPVAAFAGDLVGGASGPKAAELTARAAGPEKAVLKEMILKGDDTIENLGSSMQRHGIQTIPEARQAMAESGPQIGELSRQASTKVDLGEAGNSLKEEALDLAATHDPTATGLARQLMDHANPMLNKRQYTFEEAHKLRKFLDKRIYKVGERGEKDTAYADALGVAVAKIRAAMDHAAQQEGPEFHAAFTDASERFWTGKQVLEFKAGQKAGDMTGDIPLSNIATGGLRNGKTRSRLLARPARGASSMTATLPEFAPQLGGGALGYRLEEEQ